MYVAWLSIQYQAFTYSTASGTYGFSRVRMIFRFITIRATEPCLNLEYSGFRSRETNSPYNLIGGARRRLSSRDRVQPPLHCTGALKFTKRALHAKSHVLFDGCGSHNLTCTYRDIVELRLPNRQCPVERSLPCCHPLDISL